MTGSSELVHERRMMVARLGLLFALACGVAGFSGAALADCMGPGEARSLVRDGRVVPMIEAVRAARASVGGEMIGGRLCSDGASYVYVITFLAFDGRVARVTVDGPSGAILSVR